MALPAPALVMDVHEPAPRVPREESPSAAEVSWLRRHLGRVSWDEAVLLCRTPAEVCSLTSNRLRYDRDDGDSWSTARETWQRRRGDCEDFAICVVELCAEIGIDAWVQLYFPCKPGPGHAVAVGRWNGQLWMSSYGRYEPVESEDEIRDVVSTILWCHENSMWSARLDRDAIARRAQRHKKRNRQHPESS